MFKKINIFIIGLSFISSVFAAANPVVNTPVFEMDLLDIGDETTISVTASSANGNNLKYKWSAISGTIVGNGPSVRYIAPSRYPVANLDTVTVTVSDELSSTTTKSEIIHIDKRPTPAKIYFEENEIYMVQNERREINIMLNTGNETGKNIDIIARYDPEKITIIDADQSKNGTQIADSSIFSRVTKNNTESGKIYFSASGESFNGDEIIASISIKARKPGDTKIDFEFIKYSLKDTNFLDNLENPVDLLGQMQGINITIEPSADASNEVIINTNTPKISIKKNLPSETSKSGGLPIAIIFIIGLFVISITKTKK